MERPVRAKFNTQIYEEACEWFIECRSGDLDAASQAEFDRWLRNSPEHQSAYLEIAAIWNEGPTLDPANRWDLDTLTAQAAADTGNVVALQRPAGLATDPPRLVGDGTATSSPTSAAPVVRRRNLVAIAASILLVATGFAAYVLIPRDVYSTTLGEQRSLALHDGSTIQLNSLSKVRVRYTEHERTIELLQGQALFHVAKDSTRPFIVYSGPTRVTAVGTQFDVYRKTGDTIVTVIEGRVAIRALLLAAGEQVTVTPQATRRTLHPNVASATAWTQRQLVFDSASLVDVASEFNRYNERKLVIDPSALGALHISGVFSSTDPASLIRFLRDRPGLRVTETPTQIRIEKSP